MTCKLSTNVSLSIESLATGDYVISYFSNKRRYKSGISNKDYFYPKFVLKKWIPGTVFGENVFIECRENHLTFRTMSDEPEYLVVRKRFEYLKGGKHEV